MKIPLLMNWQSIARLANRRSVPSWPDPPIHDKAATQCGHGDGACPARADRRLSPLVVLKRPRMGRVNTEG